MFVYLPPWATPTRSHRQKKNKIPNKKKDRGHSDSKSPEIVDLGDICFHHIAEFCQNSHFRHDKKRPFHHFRPLNAISFHRILQFAPEFCLFTLFFHFTPTNAHTNSQNGRHSDMLCHIRMLIALKIAKTGFTPTHYCRNHTDKAT